MTQKSSFAMAALTVLSVLLILSISVDGTTVNVRNNCGQVITACDEAGDRGTSCFVLNANGGANLRDEGSTWTGGLIWAYPGTNTDPTVGNQAKTSASKMEMTTNVNGQDSYDLSNVDGYNLPLSVSPTSGVANGLHCGSPSCTINNLDSGCQSPNFLSGDPADGCHNADGGGTVATDGTKFFKNPCPEAISFSSDTGNTIYGCETGTNYEVLFCP